MNADDIHVISSAIHKQFYVMEIEANYIDGCK